MARLIYSVEEYYRIKGPLPLYDLFPEGGQYRATCPFCKHPGQKLYIDQATGKFKCFIPECVANLGGNILGFHALAKSITKEEARAELMYDAPAVNADGVSTPRIAKDVWTAFHNTLLVNTVILDTLISNWKITREAVEYFHLGYQHESDAVTIPVFDKSGKCVNIRYKKLHVKPDYDGPKIWNHKDNTSIKYGQRRLFPEKVLDMEEEIFIVAGEKDMLSTWSAGIRNVITPTGGEGSWNPEWNFDIQDKRIHIVFDNDEAGRFASKKHYFDQIQHICQADVVTLPLMPNYESGVTRKDLTDFWLLGKSIHDLLKLVPDTQITINNFNGGAPLAYRQALPILVTDEDEEELDRSGSRTILDEYVEYGRSYVNSPPSFHRLSGLWLLSNLLGRQTASRIGSTCVYPNLWCLLIGPTTSVRKSTTTEFARDILRDIVPDAIAMTSFTPDGAVTTLMERDGKTLTDAIYYDEIGQLFDLIKNRDYMAAMRDILIKLFNNDKIDYRKANEQKKIEDSYVTLLGSGVPTRLAELLSWRDIETGFLIRFLIALELQGEPFQPRTYESVVQHAERARLITQLRAIKTRWSKPWVIPLENGYDAQGALQQPFLSGETARNKYYRFVMEADVLARYNKFVEACTASDEIIKYEHVAQVHARLPMLLEKLMVIYAAADPSTRTFWNVAFVEMKHLLLAIKDLDWYRKHMVDLVLQIGSSEIEHFIVEIYTFLYKRKRATRTEIARKVNTDKKTLDSVLDTMHDRGLIQSRRINANLYEYMPCLT